MNHGSLCSGVGGFDLAAEWMGWNNLFHCEINPFCQTVLKYHFPNAAAHDDLKTTDFPIYRGKCDILTMGLPCQPFSVAGERKGTEDDRHLWPYGIRAVRQIQPPFVVFENVPGLVNWNGGMVFNQVQTDLENEGYEVTPFLLPATGINAPHKRERIWFIAYSENYGRERRQNNHRWNPGQLHSDESGRNKKDGCESFRHSGIAANTYSHDAGRCGHAETGCQTGGNESSQTEWQQLRSDTERTGGEGATTDTGGNRSCESSTEHQPEQFNPNGETTGTFTDAQKHFKPPRLQESGTDGHWSGFDNVYQPTDWRNFPTQPPICDGNDGFFTESLRQRIRDDSMGHLSKKEIDAILSKAATEWRNESIKGGGNAIVPGVAYQIYKAIEQFIKTIPP